MEIITFLEAAVRRWWLLAICALIGLGAAFVWTVNAPRQYQSVVTLQLNPAARSAFLPYGTDAGTQSPLASLAASYAEVLRSRAFAEVVVNRLELAAPAEEIAQATSAGLIPNTNIMRLTFTWSDSGQAQNVAQSIAQIFVAENLRRQQSQTGAQSRLADMDKAAESYSTRIESLRQQRDQLDSALTAGDLARITELNNVESRLSTLETNYTNLLVQIDRAQGQLDTATILDNATPATPAGTPGRGQVLLFGLVAGLGLASVLLMLLNELDDTLRRPDQIVSAAGAPPLATVGRIATRSWRPANRRSRLTMIEAPRSAGAEAFRTLRTNLRFAASEQPFKSLVITSAGPAEGKTLVASNLAIALANGGDRVLIVDADLRRPSLHIVFGMENDDGLVAALSGRSDSSRMHDQDAALQARRKDALNRRGNDAPAKPQPRENGIKNQAAARSMPLTLRGPVDNLWIVPAGRAQGDASELLGLASVGSLITEWESTYDIVLFDTAPVGPVSDTLLLAAHVGAALVVTRAGRTRRGALRSALAAVGQTGRPILGTVLNDFRAGPLGRYGYHGDYYYSYGKYYAQTPVAEEHTNGQVNTRQPSPTGKPAD